MSSWKHTLGGVATFGLVALLHSDLSVAASPHPRLRSVRISVEGDACLIMPEPPGRA